MTKKKKKKAEIKKKEEIDKLNRYLAKISFKNTNEKNFNRS